VDGVRTMRPPVHTPMQVAPGVLAIIGAILVIQTDNWSLGIVSASLGLAFLGSVGVAAVAWLRTRRARFARSRGLECFTAFLAFLLLMAVFHSPMVITAIAVVGWLLVGAVKRRSRKHKPVA
jgi:chromate transport protein ChrA